MAETKYGKYFISEPMPWNPAGPGPVIAQIDDTHIKGSNFYFVHWYLTQPVGIPDQTTWGGFSHGPHTHDYAEILMLLGTNPDDPFDLGAELELCMGPEMEKHIINKSTLVYIPPNFIHCPYTTKRVDRPFMFIEVNQGPIHTETPHKELIPKEKRAN